MACITGLRELVDGAVVVGALVDGALAGAHAGWAGPGWVLDGRGIELEPIQGLDDLRKASPPKSVQLPVLESGDHGLVDPGQSFELPLRQREAMTATLDDPTDEFETTPHLAVRGPDVDVPRHAPDGSPRPFTGAYLPTGDAGEVHRQGRASRRSPRTGALDLDLRTARGIRGSVEFMTTTDQLRA